MRWASREARGRAFLVAATDMRGRGRQSPVHGRKVVMAREAGRLRASGEGRTRTGDTPVFSRVLYQLSYLAAGGGQSSRMRGGGSDGCEPLDERVDELALERAPRRRRPR